MTRGEHHVLTELVREALARARDMAGRSAEVRATAAELTVIADDLRSRARAERERAQELATERLRCRHTDVVVTSGNRPAVPGPESSLAQPGRDPRGDPSVINISVLAAAALTPAVRGLRSACRRV